MIFTDFKMRSYTCMIRSLQVLRACLHHQCVQEMGNAKAKRLYEAFLPECFQRPETDQSAEVFIRDKYDKKKYMDKVIDIQMLRVSLDTPHTQLCSHHMLLYTQENMVIQQRVKSTFVFMRRRKRAAKIYPRNRSCLRRWNWWVSAFVFPWLLMAASRLKSISFRLMETEHMYYWWKIIMQFEQPLLRISLIKLNVVYSAVVPKVGGATPTFHLLKIVNPVSQMVSGLCVMEICFSWITSILSWQKKEISPKTDSQAVTDLLGLGILLHTNTFCGIM